MYYKLALRIATFLQEQGEIPASSINTYAFGLEVIISDVFSGLLLLTIAINLHAIIEGAIFYFSFMLLRKYAGGYHASTYVGCTMVYMLTFCAAVCISKNQLIPWSQPWVYLLTFFFALISFSLFSPLENKKNPLRKNRIHYKLLSLLVLLVVFVTESISHIYTEMIRPIFLSSIFAAMFFFYLEIIRRLISLHFSR